MDERSLGCVALHVLLFNVRVHIIMHLTSAYYCTAGGGVTGQSGPNYSTFLAMELCGSAPQSVVAATNAAQERRGRSDVKQGEKVVKGTGRSATSTVCQTESRGRGCTFGH